MRNNIFIICILQDDVAKSFLPYSAVLATPAKGGFAVSTVFSTATEEQISRTTSDWKGCK